MGVTYYLQLIVSTVKKELFGLSFDLGIFHFTFYGILIGLVLIELARYFVERIFK